MQAASLTVQVSPQVELLRLYNDLPAQQLPDGSVMVELGDFYSDEARKLLLRLRVPAMAALGLAQVATLELRYVELPAFVEHSVALPVTVNVVPGDEAKGRVADPVVRVEALFQEAQLAKKQASEAMLKGDVGKVQELLALSRESIRRAQETAPEAMGAELEEELDEVAGLAREVEIDLNRASKLTSASFHEKSRKRGRPTYKRSRPSGPEDGS